MLYFLPPLILGGAGPAGHSGMRVLSTSGASLGVFSTSNANTQTPIFRWRAGNLSNRQNTGKWIDSVTSPVDQKRPITVQELPPQDLTDADWQNGFVIPFFWTQSMIGVMGEIPIETEQFDWGWKPPTLVTARDEVFYENEPQLQSYIVPELNTDIDNFGFAVTVVPQATTSYNDSYINTIPMFGAYFYKLGTDDDWQLEPATFQNPYDIDYLVAQQSSYYNPELDTESDWVIVIQGGSGTQLMGFRGAVVYPSAMGEGLEWGLNIQQPTTRNEELYENINQQISYYFSEQDADSDQVFSSPTVVVTNLPWDSEDTFPAKQQMISDSDDSFGFDNPFTQGEETSNINQWFSLQWTDDDKTDSTFFSREQYSDNDEQPIVKNWSWLQWTDDDKSDATFFAREQYADADEQPSVKAWFQNQEDDVIGFNIIPPASIPQPWDAEYNPAVQLSYFFNQEDLEKSNWGWMPPVLATARDESLIENQHPMQSYFIQELESDLDIAQSTFFALEQYGEGLDIQVPQTSFYFSEPEDEMFNWGFRQPTFSAFDQDEIPVVTLQKLIHEEDFGFNPSLPTMDYSLPDEYSSQTVVVGFNLQESIAETSIQAPQEREFDPIANIVVVQIEEVPVQPVVKPFSFGDEVEHLPNPPYPITHQTEFDQVGLNAPFIISMPFAWEEYGVPPNPPWPLLDVTDYSDWIQNFTRIVTIFGTGTVQVVTFSGFVTQDTASGTVISDSGSGSSGGVQGSGKVDIIKGD